MVVEEPIRHTEIVGSGDITEGLVSMKKVSARELTPDDVGKFVGCNRDGVNYQAKILKLEFFETGHAPGVGMILQHPPIPTQKAHKEACRLPFDTELELIELVAL